ncbi:MAG: helix-turn-helix domain-containing protein [Oscillospiraceae bacterium]
MSWFDTIYADNNIPSRGKAVYMYLKNRANGDGFCYPAITTIARELHLSRSTVKRALEDLESGGYIRRSPRFRPNGAKSSNDYEIL